MVSLIVELLNVKCFNFLFSNPFWRSTQQFQMDQGHKTNYPINIWTNQNITFNKGNDPIKI